MTVGEALEQARTKAGLTVDEVSARTKIREKVIQDMEQDDFEACGGDLFARGYVRVIAGAVGTDAQPLIRLYDETHRTGSYGTGGHGTGSSVSAFSAPAPAAWSWPEPELAAEPEPELAAEPEPEPEPDADLAPSMSVLQRVKAALSTSGDGEPWSPPQETAPQQAEPGEPMVRIIAPEPDESSIRILPPAAKESLEPAATVIEPEPDEESSVRILPPQPQAQPEDKPQPQPQPQPQAEDEPQPQPQAEDEPAVRIIEPAVAEPATEEPARKEPAAWFVPPEPEEPAAWSAPAEREEPGARIFAPEPVEGPTVRIIPATPQEPESQEPESQEPEFEAAEPEPQVTEPAVAKFAVPPDPAPEPAVVPEPASPVGEGEAGPEQLPVIEPAATLTEAVEQHDAELVLQHSVIEPGPPIHPSLTEEGTRSRRRVRWGLVIAAVVILVVIVVVAMRVLGGGTSAKAANSAAQTGAAQTGAAQTSASQASTASDAAAGKAGVNAAPASPSARVSQQAGKPASKPVPSRPLPVSIAQAFGPHGTSDGDHPATAMNPVTKGSTRPWSTDWYATAAFGGLKNGTGLLLDMGKPVTVTSVIINLGTGTGASLELWAGNEPELAGLHVKASGARVGGNIVMRLRTPARARYVLVWFTALPKAAGGQNQAGQTQAGQYQADVHDITVEGHH